MGKVLLIEGQSKSGKSTILLESIRKYKDYIGGFFSQRLIDECGDVVGFRLLSIDEVTSVQCKYNPTMANVFLVKTSKGWVKNEEVFQKYGIEILNKSKNKDFIVMDEVGGIELNITEFKEGLYDIFRSNKPCIGILKSKYNYKAMENVRVTNSDNIIFRDKFISDIKEIFQGEILSYSTETREDTIEKIRGFIEYSLKREEGRI